MAKSKSTSTFRSPKISSILALHAFGCHSSTWESYHDRINCYCSANRIEIYEDKKYCFYRMLGIQPIIYYSH